MLEVAADQRVGDVKGQLRVKEGIPIAEQHLSYEGVELQDDHRLSDYKITLGSPLNLVERPQHQVADPAVAPRATNTERPQGVTAASGNAAGFDRGASLAARLRRVTAAARPPPAPHVFTWGKMKGKTYEDVFEESPDYVQWCAEHLATKPSACQKEWVTFIEEKVAELEKELAEKHGPAADSGSTVGPLTWLCYDANGGGGDPVD